ncbi:hypothetical protein H310_09218 [Aphanomyces invadans]|uniref:Thioredoxin domain-containing protein n=1 Tax=Aphanomyces invadans TaxID=157072 RepID=A0A024TVC4_9STRA|nr:hypothetical protein H310_09218 [Aphanomyces invadans]ETV97899.1 hypothetical protein H310_09218 [Aphanomyces invadans]|eukprot:XP_008873460.1 hypothetical protein H310_09218 [Aphanomyces invadans]
MTHFLKHTKLVNAAGAIQEPAAKTLALYFAADWCPECRDFQPKLNEFYSKVNEQAHQFDVVFISSDANEDDQLAHFRNKQGPWLAVPFDDPIRDELKRKFKICAKKEMEAVGVSERVGGIPSVVIVTSSGEVVDADAAIKIDTDGVQDLSAWL